MGYDTAKIVIPLRLDCHGGPEQRRDRQEAENLAVEIQALINRVEGYRRIATIGVNGP